MPTCLRNKQFFSRSGPGGGVKSSVKPLKTDSRGRSFPFLRTTQDLSSESLLSLYSIFCISLAIHSVKRSIFYRVIFATLFLDSCVRRDGTRSFGNAKLLLWNLVQYLIWPWTELGFPCRNATSV